MINTLVRTARKQFHLLLAVLIGAAIGSTFGLLAVATVNPSAFDYVQQKATSLHYRMLELSPRPYQPEFVPTPFEKIAAVSPPTETPLPKPLAKPAPISTASTAPLPIGVTSIQPAVSFRGIRHDYQRWNNCGPTTLEMDLSYFGRNDTQADIAAFTKPNPDDRNVRPDELAAYARHAGLQTLIRENGTLDRLKLLVSNGLPVIVETSLEKQPQGWMGHYRLISGYDSSQFTTMDSYDGANVKIAFDDFDAAWRAFNRLYIVVYPSEQAGRVRSVLSDTLDDQAMYIKAADRARSEIQANPNDAFAQFNLGTSLVALKRNSEAASAFDKARLLGLPWRTLWYQFGPFDAYLQTGRYSEVVTLADSVLPQADDLEEAHYYKGLALRAMGRNEEARSELEAALRYNSNYADAKSALAIH